ncbi:hypothetical protein B0H11DRAFT_1932078 [Mycena galericulata]|nr:hypothetical protein B0H11DRAFT_1932078 [Mycena galericulata]
MNEDTEMGDANHRRTSQTTDGEFGGSVKKQAVSGPARQQYERALENEAYFRDTLKLKAQEAQALRAQLGAEQVAAARAAEAAREEYDHLVEQYKLLVAEKVELEEHENQMEGQIIDDQRMLSEYASASKLQILKYRSCYCQKMVYNSAARNILEGQKQLMAQSDAIQKLQRSLVDCSDEVILLRAKMQRKSSNTTPIQRRGRNVKLRILHNQGATTEIPLDPVPLPATSAPEIPATPTVADMDREELLKLIAEVFNKAGASTTQTTKITRKSRNGRVKVVAPTNKQDIIQYQALLRDEIYEKFNVRTAQDFMTHVPVTPGEMAEAPAKDDWRWDFSEGYTHSEWNKTIIKRIVDNTIAFDDRLTTVDRNWLEKEVLEKLKRYRGEWSRLRPKLNETKEEAEARAVEYHEKRLVAAKSISAKARIKESNPKAAADLETWKRLLMILQRFGPDGMSSEEEGETTTVTNERVKIFKVKICIWRAPAISDYWRIVDKETQEIHKRRRGGGTEACARHGDVGYGRADPPKGLPRCLYDGAWLEKMGAQYEEELEISDEAFSLLVAATGRM